jgi:hypothetical protein
MQFVEEYKVPYPQTVIPAKAGTHGEGTLESVGAAVHGPPLSRDDDKGEA